MKTKYCMIETSFANNLELESVIKELLKNKLVSSCQVVESKSTWNWNNNLESSKEYLLFLKTKKELSKKIYQVIKKYHSYEVFEFAILTLDSISNSYLNWIEKETQ